MLLQVIFNSPKQITKDVDSELVTKFVAMFKEALEQAPGNDELNSAWNWESATRQPDGSIQVASTMGGPALRLVTSKQMAVEYPGAMANVGVNMINAVPFGEAASLSDSLVKSIELYGVKFKRGVDPETQKIYYESTILHEWTHTLKDKFGSTNGEFSAFRAQFNYLAATGIVEPVPDSVIRNMIVAYAPESYCRAMLDSTDGELKSELFLNLPGARGTEFRRIKMEILNRQVPADQSPEQAALRQISLGSLLPEPWATEYGTRFRASVKDWYFHQAIRNAELNSGNEEVFLKDIGRHISEALKVSEAKLAEFDKFVGYSP